jgi:hypothetical protein
MQVQVLQQAQWAEQWVASCLLFCRECFDPSPPSHPNGKSSTVASAKKAMSLPGGNNFLIDTGC